MTRDKDLPQRDGVILQPLSAAHATYARVKTAFTAIEMVAVLFLAAIMATLSAVSLSGLRHKADLHEVIDRISYADALARHAAERLHHPTELVLDADRGTMIERDSAASTGASERTVYTLPGRI